MELCYLNRYKIKGNRPDISVKDYKRKIRPLIYISVLTDNNTSVKEYQKLYRYKHQEKESEKLKKNKQKNKNIVANKITTMSVIVGVLLMIKKWLSTISR